ncbi:MAG: prepilin-type N-terminal cleavage/methylation domain-containing protein [Verrucomicrobiae bacterium]|nr:prepilin-type N-terminal cleavage/methylation domain-containing protein [Verrucomicrobiae bacterium]
MSTLNTASTTEKAVCSDSRGGFTLVEVLVSSMIFMIAFGALYMAHYQAIRQLDGLRQMSRAEDVTLANIEYLRTRNWDELLAWSNIATTSALRISTNMIESMSLTNGLIVNYVELDPSDPEHIFLTGDKDQPPRRNIHMVFWPDGSAVVSGDTSHSMIKATVTTSWKVGNTWLTNSMTTILTKGGMTATDI